jgi:two-component system chemotaxis response regulator CheY
MRILVVEDSPLVQRMYGLVFPRREHELIAVDNGRKALKALYSSSTTPYNLILLDLRMPDMDGVEFIRELRAAPTLSRIPIVLTTAEPDQSVLMIQARALGVTAVVRKPWKPQELRDLVQLIVKQRVA